jgi:hypothetical protein
VARPVERGLAYTPLVGRERPQGVPLVALVSNLGRRHSPAVPHDQRRRCRRLLVVVGPHDDLVGLLPEATPGPFLLGGGNIINLLEIKSDRPRSAVDRKRVPGRHHRRLSLRGPGAKRTEAVGRPRPPRGRAGIPREGARGSAGLQKPRTDHNRLGKMHTRRSRRRHRGACASS